MNFEGHGDYLSSNEFSMQLFVDQVISFLKQSKVENTHIFGYSIGGYVALKLALKAPNMVSKIITLGTKFDWSKEATDKEIAMLNPELMEAKIPDYVAILKSLHSPNNWKDVVGKTANLMLSLVSGSKLSSEDLMLIENDVLISVGEKDRMVSIEESSMAVSFLRNANLKVIDNFRHPLELVDKEMLSRIICDFLKK
jgi:pimeloyl-ACP methyl ester carboxylesterase